MKNMKLILKFKTLYNLCKLYKIAPFASSGFDPPTCGLWAHRAAPAPRSNIPLSLLFLYSFYIFK